MFFKKLIVFFRLADLHYSYFYCRFKKAETNFKEALQKISKIHKAPLPTRWVPLLNNLGHTCRKLKKYDEALEYHHKVSIT